MSLSGVLQIATSGMRTAQTGIRTVSDNVSNVNTPGYVRKIVDQQASVISGAGAGVEVAGVRRAADIYLQKASIDTAGEVGRTSAVAEFLDRAQALFGDPSEPSSSFFGRLDPIFSAFSVAGGKAASHLERSTAIVEVSRFFDDARTISAQLRDLSRQTEIRIGSTVTRVNGLLEDINALNNEISRANISGRDASGSENVQSQMVDELATLIDLRIQPRKNGGVSLSATDGTPLTGQSRATFLYDGDGAEAGLLRMSYEDGQPNSLAEGLGGGTLKGLFELKEVILPAVHEQLGEFTSQAADALNRAHNAAASVPALAEVVGKRMSIDLPVALTGFTGRTTVALTQRNTPPTADDGLLDRRVDIDFNASTMTDGTTTVTFDPADPGAGGFLAKLNEMLLDDPATQAGPPRAQASFSDGTLRITAAGARGVSIAEPIEPDLRSDRAGRSFSHYFGLNDLVRSNVPTVYDQGLGAFQAHGFATGGEIQFRFADGAGSRFRDVTVTIGPGDVTMGQLRDKLNAGAGLSGQFALDDTGALRFTSAVEPQVTLSVLRDTTVHAVSGSPMSRVHGLGAARGARADQFQVRPDISADSAKLSLAQFEYGAVAGGRALSRGDGRGGFNLAQSGEVNIRFERAGDIADTRTSLSSYAAQLGGVLGRRSQQAEERMVGAETIAQEAAARRSSVEGVNLDEELVQLTVYQQAYNASARLIMAAKEMYDVLADLI